ncbi:hypothetical protein BUALT_Bualt12G0066200 [Buddleja alternifolia]|uniref:DUF4216 domain-containing protein n=1 Tax=Buddleja alternifolia TaxID=168488 RepID=A0AAV6WQG0_9LAMI|nr:hypothetical protein BUALT_Bualt12G0066200 [Buddleja alternifolia]
MTDDMQGLVHDAFGINDTDLNMEEEPNEQAKTFFKLLDDARQELYSGFIAKSYYEVHKIIGALGLACIKIDACPNDCMLYWKEHENDAFCHVCKTSRYAQAENDSINEDDSSTKYLEEVETEFNKVKRNDDNGGNAMVEFPIFSNHGRHIGRQDSIVFDKETLTKVENMHLIGNPMSKELRASAQGPNPVGRRYIGFIVHGFRFHGKKFGKRRTQNSGLVFTTQTSSYDSRNDVNPIVGDVSYYGVLKDINELDDFEGGKTVLFECDWVSAGRAQKQDETGFTLVNFFRSMQHNELFVLASQAQLIFYIEDPIEKGDSGGNFNPHDATTVQSNLNRNTRDRATEDITSTQDDPIDVETEAEMTKLEELRKEPDFDPNIPIEQQMLDIPSRVDEDQYKVLAKDWMSDKSKKISEKNKQTRATLELLHRMDKKSFAIVKEIMKQMKEVAEQEKEVAEQEKEVAEQEPECSNDNDCVPYLNDAYAKIMGQDKHGYLRMYGMGVTPVDVCGAIPSRDVSYILAMEYKSKYMEAVEKFDALNAKVESLSALVNGKHNLLDKFKIFLFHLQTISTRLHQCHIQCTIG